jgi:hypothetical protein
MDLYDVSIPRVVVRVRAKGLVQAEDMAMGMLDKLRLPKGFLSVGYRISKGLKARRVSEGEVMSAFRLVYYELVRLTRTVEAPSLEEAIAKASEIEDWEDCDETTHGTNGVEFAYNEKGERIYEAGTIAGFEIGDSYNPEKEEYGQ